MTALRPAPTLRPPVIAVLDYGIGNLRSAEKALQHLGADAALVDDPDRAAAAAGVVLPGVGAFGPCAQALRSSGLDKAALAAVERGRALPRDLRRVPAALRGLRRVAQPSRGSASSPERSGGWPRGQAPPDAVERPGPSARQVRRPAACSRAVPSPAWVYFVHSYAPERTADTSSTCDYGGPVTASAERGPVWGTQFHPEKSGSVGLGILANFVRAAGRRPDVAMTAA